MNSKEKEFYSCLWTQNYTFMTRHAYHRLHNPDLAKEAVQETFKIALEKLDTLKNHPNPDGWLMVTLKNVCLRINLKEWRQALIRVPPPSTQDQGLLEILPANIRTDDAELLTFYYAEGHSLAAIAEHLNTTPAIVKKRLYRARERFKAFLLEEGEENAEKGQ